MVPVRGGRPDRGAGCRGSRPVDALSLDDLTGWLKTVHYNNRTQPAVLYARLTSATRGPTGSHGQALAAITTAYLAVIAALMDQISVLERQISHGLVDHPDRAIFTELPRAGRLLAEIGDARGRFPTANSMAGLAGVVPSTRRSGHTTIVAYRWAVDAQLRDAVCDFAADTRHASPWAADLYQKARDRGCRHPHAVRILARAWIGVIWKCWITHTPYDPARHGALQHLLRVQQAAA